MRQNMPHERLLMIAWMLEGLMRSDDVNIMIGHPRPLPFVVVSYCWDQLPAVTLQMRDDRDPWPTGYWWPNLLWQIADEALS